MALNNTALKELRKEKKLTQTELASKLDISQKSYSRTYFRQYYKIS